MHPIIYYCYDAYCGWCYGFSPVIKKLAETYNGKISFEVLSGGMILAENAQPIAATAGYISSAYKRVEELTGIRFGPDYLWHVFNPSESDWFPHSEKAAIALCIFKELYPEQQVAFATDLQYALHYEGRDLTDDEAYRHLLEKFSINTEGFYKKLHSEEYRDRAHQEFALCKQLQVTGFPQLLIQVSGKKFYLLSKGYTDFETVNSRLESVFSELKNTAF